MGVRADATSTVDAAPPSGVGITWRRNSRTLYRALAATRGTGQAVRKRQLGTRIRALYGLDTRCDSHRKTPMGRRAH